MVACTYKTPMWKAEVGGSSKPRNGENSLNNMGVLISNNKKGLERWLSE